MPLHQLPGILFELFETLAGIPGLGKIGDTEDASKAFFDLLGRRRLRELPPANGPRSAGPVRRRVPTRLLAILEQRRFSK